MNFKLNLKSLIPLAIIFFLLGAIGNLFIANRKLTSKIGFYDDAYESSFKLVDISRMQNKSLEKLNKELSKENGDLLSIVSDMKSRPDKVKYVYQTTTELVPAKPVEVFSVLPAEYVYKLNSIPIAKFETSENDYKFTTYDLKFKSTIVVDEKGKVGSSLLVTSSESEDWHEVPVTTEASTIGRKYPNVDIDFHLGLSTHSQYLAPQPTAIASAIHLAPELDIVSAGVTVGPHPLITLYPVGYNVGKPLPVLDDLWLWGGVSTDTNLQPGVSVSLTTKF